MVCHGVLACKPGGGLVKLVANQGVGRGWIGGGSGKSLVNPWLLVNVLDITCAQGCSSF